MPNPRDQLRDLGWGKLEAASYCALVEFGQMKAADIAATINARQEKVYHPLKKLQSKGYVLLKEENPKVYAAQNPITVIKDERAEFQEDTGNILSELQESWEMSEEGTPQAEEYAWVLSGNDGFQTEIHELIGQADESILGFDTRLQMMRPYVSDVLEDQILSDIEIRLVGNVEDKLASLSDYGADVRYEPDISLPSFYVADGERVLLNVSAGKSTLVFEDTHFADIMLKEFESRYKEAQDLTHEA